MNPVGSGSLRFGNFEVLSRPDGSPHLLGGGAFGKTYKARHLFLEQIVALKVINEQFLNDRAIKERFLREARVVHGLRHPHIAHVMDFGEVNGTLYYAMDFCDGGSLDDYVRRQGPQDAATVRGFARQLAEALACAHGRGFIHRDIKPANVMLAEAAGGGGSPPLLKLVDFGLVKNLQPTEGDGTASLTLDGQHFFTILFASPEQLEERALDARSDLFSLGMTLWFLLKGSAPESGASATVVAKRLGAEAYRGQLPPSLPAGFHAILSKLLEKSPENRYQGATELLAALDEPEPPPATAGTDASSSQAGEDPAAETVVQFPDATAPPPAPVAPPPLPPPPPMVPSGPPPIEREYLVLQSLGRSPLGPLYRVQRRADGQTVALTLLSDTFQEDPARLEGLRRDVDRLRGAPHEAVAQVFGLQEFAEGTVLAQEWTAGGVSLFEVLKGRGSLAYADALRALRPVAEGADFLQALAGPGAALGAEEIFLSPEAGGTFAEPPEALLKTPLRAWPPFHVRVRPVLARDDAAADAGATMGEGAMGGNARVEFAALLYQLVAGRRPSPAARMTRTAYTAVAGLGEEGNRLLAACLCDEAGFDGCVGILHALSRSEGVNEVPAGGPSSSGSRGFGGTTPVAAVTARATPPPPLAPPAPASTGRAVGGSSGSSGPHAPVSAPAPPPVPVLQVQVPMTVPAVVVASPRAAATPPPVPATAALAPPALPPPPVPVSGGGGGKQPGVSPWLVFGVPALVVGLAVIGGAVLLLSRLSNPAKPPSLDPDRRGLPTTTPQPKAISVAPLPAVVPTAAPTPTAPPVVAREFVLAGGVRPANATFELNGRPVRPTPGEGGSLVVPLADGRGGELKVSARGYVPRAVPVAPGGTWDGALELARPTVRVAVQAERNRSDYATAVFTALAPLPNEDPSLAAAEGGGGNPVSVDLGALPGAADLPTGLYHVGLRGAAGGRADATTVQPFALLDRLTVREGEGVTLSLPPSFAGRYQQEFITRLDPTTTVVVTRVLVIEPGLGGGHVDDAYVPTTNGVRGTPEQLRGVPVTGLRLDERGTLRGLIRFTQLGAKDVSYDEQFEMTYSPQTHRLTIQGGDWEVEPDNPALTAQLLKKQGRAPHRGKPPPRPLARLE